MLTPYLPFPLITGGQTRSYNLIKRLSELGHKITLFCLVKTDKEREYIPELEKFCTEVKVFKRPEKPWSINNILTTGFSFYPFLVIRNWAGGEKSEVKKKLRDEKFDLIHAETFYVMPHIPKTQVPVVLVDQTIEYEVYRHFVDNFRFAALKPLLYFDVKKMKFWELKYWRQAKKVIAMSEEDKKIMRSEIPNLDVGIVPNGVDSDFFSEKIFEKPKEPTVLYLGNFTWLQNREAVHILMTKIWPKIKEAIPACKLWIIGKDAKNFFSKLESEDIRVEEVRDVREAYQGATILVAPIYGSGGTRYKNFEAFASGLPVVTTSIGIGGTSAGDGEEVVIRDKPEEIAAEAIKLLNNSKERERIAKKAKKKVAEKYDWASITEKLNKIYVEVSNG
jgi:polysaccharide biosynthesis protein PslH